MPDESVGRAGNARESVDGGARGLNAPGDGGDPPRTPWGALFRAQLRDGATPRLVLPQGPLAAPALHAAAEGWRRALREAGLAPGDRIVCALPPGPGFLAVLVAALADGYTFAPVAAGSDVALLLVTLDARLAIAADAGAPHTAGEDAAGRPVLPLPALRPVSQPATPDVRFLLRTGGTTGTGRWIALGDENVLAVLRSHAPAMALDGARVLSVLPWHHAFGLVLGVLAALLHAEALVRDPHGGRDLAALVALADAHDVTHCDLVPALVDRLARDARGSVLLDRLRGGIVGGAAVHAPLAARLARTRLRVGYGQTEAAPGITVGEPGEWRPRWLGRALGCEVRRDDDGVLAFRGPNACRGEWRDGALHRFEPGTWRRTGDVVSATDDGGWCYEGRASDRFKLSNGRVVEAAHWEARLRTAHPTIDELVLHTRDGETLELVLSMRDGAPPPVVADLAPTLGPLAERLAAVRAVDADAWGRTLKGEVNRYALPG